MDDDDDGGEALSKELFNLLTMMLMQFLKG